MILLLFGQPASGKTTLAKELQQVLQVGSPNPSQVVHIDGDRWREVTCNHDYSREGRIRNLKAAFDMALYLEQEGFFVILSFVTPYAELREYLQSRAIDLQMVYLHYKGDRGRHGYFVEDFEMPGPETIRIDTSRLRMSECIGILQGLLSQKVA